MARYSLCGCGHPKDAHTNVTGCHATIHVGIGTHKHPGVYSYPCPCRQFEKADDE